MLREFSEHYGIIQNVLDNKFYDVQFDGKVLQLNEQELKSYNPNEKVVTLTGLKKQLNTQPKSDLRPEKDGYLPSGGEADGKNGDDISKSLQEGGDVNSGDINSGDINSGDINSDDISNIRKNMKE